MQDWEKKYWTDRASKLPHYKAAHELGGGNIQPSHHHHQPQHAQHSLDGTQDITSILQQRLANSVMNQQISSGVSGRVCFVKEGVQAYRLLPTDGFGSTVPLVIPIGPVTGMTGKQFENKGPKRCFVVDNSAGSYVDLTEITNHPEKMMTLVQLNAPFVGSIMVLESSVIPLDGSGGSNNPQNRVLKG